MPGLTTTELQCTGQQCTFMRAIFDMHGFGDNYTHTHNPKYRIDGWCFHYVTFVFGVKQWASVLFLATGPWWAPECLHYFQETEHQCIFTLTIKEIRGQPWVNTFKGTTRWRHGALDPQDGNYCLTVSAVTAPLCVFVYSVLWDEERQSLWPVTLSILLWQ